MTAWHTRKWIQRKSGSERLALIRLSISIVLSFWLVQTITSAAFGTPPETIVPKPGIIMFVTFENGTTKPVDDPGQPPTTSEGCAEGWGYYVDDPNPICEPLDAIGEGPPKDLAFCAALGCPYNPPNLSNPPPESIPGPGPEPELKPQPDTSRNCTDLSQGFCP
jgi:hypothetical protein